MSSRGTPRPHDRGYLSNGPLVPSPVLTRIFNKMSIGWPFDKAHGIAALTGVGSVLAVVPNLTGRRQAADRALSLVAVYVRKKSPALSLVTRIAPAAPDSKVNRS